EFSAVFPALLFGEYGVSLLIQQTATGCNPRFVCPYARLPHRFRDQSVVQEDRLTAGKLSAWRLLCASRAPLLIGVFASAVRCASLFRSVLLVLRVYGFVNPC